VGVATGEEVIRVLGAILLECGEDWVSPPLRKVGLKAALGC
jgi:hypothetical protein